MGAANGRTASGTQQQQPTPHKKPSKAHESEIIKPKIARPTAFSIIPLVAGVQVF